MSVVGLDFGSESCIVAVARRRGIDVLQNEIGSRKTESCLAFTGKQRLVGGEAKAQAMSNYKNTYTYVKRFLGRNVTDPELDNEKYYVQYEINYKDNKINFEGEYDEKTETFYPEQITAAMLQKLKTIAETGLEAMVSDCVIGVPSYWNDVQRRAMLNAASIAGLNVLRLMNETTAVALNYGILRPLPKDDVKKVVFLDIGAGSTCCSVVSFKMGSLNVMATAFDANLGGRNFDDLLVKHFAAYIQDKYKMDVMSNQKATMKLFKECERVKRILSANSKVVFNVEYIMNDTDVKGEITREEFEEMVKKDLTGKLNNVLGRALESAGVKADEVDSVEIVGGATRIPIVQGELSKFFGKEMSKTCDSDESVARGCALQCAMLSPAFRVREFEVCDTTPYPIEVQWGVAPTGGAEADIEQTSPLFTVNNPIPSVKVISFKDRTEPFQLVARYADKGAVANDCDQTIGRFVVSGVKPVGEETPKIKVRVKMDLHGLCKVTSAHMLIPEEEKDEEMKPAEEAAKPAEKEAEPAKEGEGMDTTEDAEKKPENEEGAANDANDEGDKKAEEEPKAEEPKSEEPPKKKYRKEELTVTSHIVGGLTADHLKVCLEKEAAMSLADKVITETNEARNQLESYCLEMRSRVEDELSEFVPDAEREAFCSKCSEFEDWLYDEEGETAQKSVFKAKLAELAKTGDAAVRREYEASHREEAVGSLKKEVGKFELLAATDDEKYAHIEAAERKKVTDACAAADKWLDDKLSAQQSKKKCEDPAVSCADLLSKLTALRKECAAVMDKPKPKPKVEPKKEEPKKDEATEGEAPAANDAPDAETPAEEEPKTEEAPETADGMDMD